MLSFVSGLVEVWRGRGQGPASWADTRLSPATAGILTLAQGLADLDPLQFGGLSESKDVPPFIIASSECAHSGFIESGATGYGLTALDKELSESILPLYRLRQ